MKGRANSTEARLCGARKSSGKGTCRLPAAPGSTRCRVHGGQAERRIVHGLYATGLRRALQEAYAESLRELLDDPRAALLRDAAAVRAVMAAVVRNADERGLVDVGETVTSGVSPTGPVDLRERRRASVVDPLAKTAAAIGRLVEAANASDPAVRAATLARTEVETRLAAARAAEMERNRDPAADVTLRILVDDYGDDDEPPSTGAESPE